MGTSIVNNGLSGLVAAQAGILTTSHNISNASTPGFNRQAIVQTTNIPMQTGSGFFGQGTNVQTVQRVYSQYLAGSVMAAETQAGQMDAYLSQIKQIDNMLADSSAGLSPALSDFFKGVQDVASNPSSIPARQSMLSSAQALVARFQAINQAFDEQRQGINEQITSEVGIINSYSAQIAQLNQQIILANAGSNNQPPNDLLDQRDQLLQSLNKEIRVSTVTQDNGTLSVFIGNGQPLVMNTSSYTLTAQPSRSDPQQTVIGLQTINSGTIELQDSSFTGGALGGLLAFTHESLDPAQNALGRVALGLAQDFNQQQELGQDLNGAGGVAGGNPVVDLFRFPTNVSNGMYAYSNLYANKNNAGNAVLTANVTQSDYRLVYDNTLVPPQYKVYRLNDNGAMAPAGQVTPLVPPLTPGATVYVDGVKITASAAAVANGDSFTIKPGNPLATRVFADSSNAVAGVADLDVGQAGNGALTGNDYRIDATPAGYVVTRLSDNAVITPPMNSTNPPSMTFEGVTVYMQGNPKVGDSFILQPTRNAARDITVNISDPRQIAAGAPFRTGVDPTNKGTGAIDAGSMTGLSPNTVPNAVPLGGRVTFTYNAGTWTAAAAWDTSPAPQIWNGKTFAMTPGQQNVIDLNGVRFTVSGTPQNGDKIYLEPNANAISDNRNAQAFGALQTSRLLAGNSATYEEAYAQIVSQIGNKTREVMVTGQAQQTLANEAKDAVQQLSGVNLDEEAANLIRYQQAYQASAKMIDVGSKLFDSFLSAIG